MSDSRAKPAALTPWGEERRAPRASAGSRPSGGGGDPAAPDLADSRSRPVRALNPRMAGRTMRVGSSGGAAGAGVGQRPLTRRGAAG